MKGDYPELSIDPEKAFYIVMKAREFEEKTESSGLEEGSNPTDDKDVAILEDSADDATEEELAAALHGLSDDEKLDVLVLTRIGRGDFTMEEWDEAREEARGTVDKNFTRYLIGTPLFSDYLEEGLALTGHDFDEFAQEHF